MQLRVEFLRSFKSVRFLPSTFISSIGLESIYGASVCAKPSKPVFKCADHELVRHLPYPLSIRYNGSMAIGKTSEIPSIGVKAQQQTKQSGAGTQALPFVRVEQPHRTLVGDVQVGLTTAILEQKGVNEMLKNYQGKGVPEYYVKPESMRQQSTPLMDSDGSENWLPLIDLESSPEDLIGEIRKACQMGFFQIINHGTNPNLLKRMASASEEFFALPVEEKVLCSTPKKAVGPVHFGGGSKGDWRDVLKINCKPPSETAMDRWPLRPPGFRDTLMQYVTEQEVLVRRLLKLISESLGLDKDYIENECADPRVLVAINHYPPCPDPSVTMGIRAHSDPNTLTILLPDQVPGLQMFKDGLWFDVKPVENALVVNAGDHLQILSNARYPSCVHRVVNNKTDRRTSVAMFFSPNMKAHIKPAPSLVDEEHPAKYREFVYSEFLKNFYSSGGPNTKVILSQFQEKNKSET